MTGVFISQKISAYILDNCASTVYNDIYRTYTDERSRVNA